VVFRWQRSPDNRDSHLLSDGRKLRIYHGRLQFYDARSLRVHYPLGDTFKVKVGGVSGADAIFTAAEGNIEVVCSTTATTGHTKRMLHGDAARRAFALDFVTIGKLRSRGIREFHQDNWWEWGRSWHQSDSPRIYVNCKTRNEKPFFIHPATAYDGSVLALIPHDPTIDLQAWCDHLNAQDWASMGFKSSGRYLFSAGALQACQLPLPVLG
jgi:adenine-specific DNA-methyltransferase